MQREIPGFLSRPRPQSEAVDAIERGIRRRSARVWAPRFVGPMLAMRGLIQPLAERRLRRSRNLPEALRLAESPPEGEEPLISSDPNFEVSPREPSG